MEIAAFLLILFLSNVIQGITGFAGTILAMPPSLILVGYHVAKPVLNVLGLLSGIYVFAGSRKKVLWDELKQIVTMMSIGIAAGILLKGYFAGRENILYPPLGIFVLLLSAQGMARLWKEGREKEIGEDKMPSGGKNSGGFNQMRTRGLLILAGLVHGIFVCGGPLLIGYLTKRVDDKKAFRATISTVWIVLNTIELMDDIRSGLWETEIVTLLLMTIPFFLAGMFVGERLVRQMSQKTFMVITYVLLIISGISLLFK